MKIEKCHRKPLAGDHGGRREAPKPPLPAQGGVSPPRANSQARGLCHRTPPLAARGRHRVRGGFAWFSLGAGLKPAPTYPSSIGGYDKSKRTPQVKQRWGLTAQNLLQNLLYLSFWTESKVIKNTGVLDLDEQVAPAPSPAREPPRAAVLHFPFTLCPSGHNGLLRMTFWGKDGFCKSFWITRQISKKPAGPY
jgi:hypothetical protein